MLLYRRHMGLVDYDERMAVLIQQVQGRRQGGVLLPDAAGVAYSRMRSAGTPRSAAGRIRPAGVGLGDARRRPDRR